MQLSVSTFPLDLVSSTPAPAKTAGPETAGDTNATDFDTLLNGRNADSGAQAAARDAQTAASANEVAVSAEDSSDDAEGEQAGTEAAAQQDAVASWLAAAGFILPPAPTPATLLAGGAGVIEPAAAATDLPAQTASADGTNPTPADCDRAFSSAAGPEETTSIASHASAFAPGVAEQAKQQPAGAVTLPASHPSVVANGEGVATAAIPVPGAPSASATAEASSSQIAGAVDLRGTASAESEQVAVVELATEDVARIVEARVRSRASSAEGTRAMAAGGTNIPAAMEKFAAEYQRFSDTAARDLKSADKKSLTTEATSVADATAPLGINAAKPEIQMSAFAPNASSSSAVADAGSVVAAEHGHIEAFAQPDLSDTHAEVAQAARRSVASAIAVAEHFGTGDKRAVTLQFSVSGVDLGVRVELRDSGIHTTFRTDSPELRNALAREWQAVTSTQLPDRSSRMADPVFASASSGSSTQGDAGSADQRGAHSREGQRFPEEFAALRGNLRSRSAATAAVAALPPVVLRPVPFSAGRLHTFA